MERRAGTATSSSADCNTKRDAHPCLSLVESDLLRCRLRRSPFCTTTVRRTAVCTVPGIVTHDSSHSCKSR
jgi:hypothetical protein